MPSNARTGTRDWSARVSLRCASWRTRSGVSRELLVRVGRRSTSTWRNKQREVHTGKWRTSTSLTSASINQMSYNNSGVVCGTKTQIHSNCSEKECVIQNSMTSYIERFESLARTMDVRVQVETTTRKDERKFLHPPLLYFTRLFAKEGKSLEHFPYSHWISPPLIGRQSAAFHAQQQQHCSVSATRAQSVGSSPHRSHSQVSCQTTSQHATRTFGTSSTFYPRQT